MTRLLIFLFAALPCWGANWYVSPTGTDGGAGTLASPLSLWRALGDSGASPAGPGDTIYVRGGTYYVTNAPSGIEIGARLVPVGTPIVVKPYLTEHPILQATAYNNTVLYVYGSNTWYQGFEIWNSDPNRNPFRNAGIMVFGPGNRFINNVIHDTGQGIYVSDPMGDTQIYGNVIYNTGWVTLGFGHTAGIYAHSSYPGTLASDNIICNNISLGIQFYGATPHSEQSPKGIRNIVFNPQSLSPGMGHAQGIIVGGDTDLEGTAICASNVVFYGDTGYSAGIQMGFIANHQDTGICISNYVVGETIMVGGWTNLTYTYNVVANPYTYTDVKFFDWSGTNFFVWDNNQYWKCFEWLVNPEATMLDFANWKSTTGYDLSSSYTANSSGILPTVTNVWVFPNSYEAGRGNVAVVNWQNADNVNVDLSGVCSFGRIYVVKNAEDYLGPVVKQFTYSGSLVSFPMTNMVPATPIGLTVPGASGPAFNAFVVQEKANANLGLVALKNVKVKLIKVK